MIRAESAQPGGGLADQDAAQERRLRAQASEPARLSPAEEESLLAERAKPDAKEALVRHNLDLVADQADGHAAQGVSFPDLFQEGTIGLVDAIATYDGRGSFRDFARLHVGLQMDAFVAEEGAARREAADAVEDARTLDLAQVMLQKELGRRAKPPELEKALGWDAARVERVTLWLEDARRRNDELTLEFLEEADLDDIVDLSESDEDPRRRLPGAGPDE